MGELGELTDQQLLDSRLELYHEIGSLVREQGTLETNRMQNTDRYVDNRISYYACIQTIGEVDSLLSSRGVDTAGLRAVIAKIELEKKLANRGAQSQDRLAA